MNDELLALRTKALKELESAAERSDIEKLRQRYLGRKGLLTLHLKKKKDLLWAGS